MSYLYPKRSQQNALSPHKASRTTGSDDNFDLKTPGKILLPKRYSELSPYAPDDDEDDPNNLNCALLSHSGLLSPILDDDLECEKLPNQNENDKNSCNKSFQVLFEKLNLDGTAEKQENAKIKEEHPARQRTSAAVPYQPTYRQMMPSRNIQNVLTDKASDQLARPSLQAFNGIKSSSFEAEKEEKSKLPAVRSLKFVENDKSYEEPKQNDPNGIETPMKEPEFNFVTPGPAVTSASTVHQKHSRVVFSSNQNSRPRTAPTNNINFKSQKILFTTPNSVSCPPMIKSSEFGDLSFNDSVYFSMKKPLSPVKELRDIRISSEELFAEADEITMARPNEEILKINENEYGISEKLGFGGSSSVLLARLLRGGSRFTEFAIKVVDLRGEPAIIEGYINETKLLAKLQGNDSVIRLFEYHHDPAENKLFLVMERGESDLHNILKSYKSDIPLYTLLTFWLQIIESVHYIHQNGVIHSDLKPANFLMVNGRLKLIDFGIASNIAVDSTSIIKFSQAGTINYISPEALIDTSCENSPSGRNQPKVKISTKSDVWSMGCILYLFIYKQTPFSNIKNLHAKFSAITNPNTIIEYAKMPNYYPEILLEMAQHCLRHNPKQRISAADLLKYPFHMMIPPKNS